MKTEINERFFEWADSFFITQPQSFFNKERTVIYFSIEEIIEKYRNETNLMRTTHSLFMRLLKQYCKHCGFKINPKKLQNATGGRIIMRLNGKVTSIIAIRKKRQEKY